MMDLNLHVMILLMVYRLVMDLLINENKSKLVSNMLSFIILKTPVNVFMEDLWLNRVLKQVNFQIKT